MGFCSDGPCECIPAKFEVRSFSLPLPEIIAIGVLSGVANPQTWERGGHRGSLMVPFKRALVSSYMLYMFCSIFKRSRGIAAFALQHAIPPTSRLSPKFPHVPLGLGGWPLGSEERMCWANCPFN